MKNNWNGIIKILEIQQIRQGKVIWEAKNLYNILHQLGEQFFLQALFANNGTILPVAYFLGLDARSSLSVTQTIVDLLDEPVGNGYLRQQLSISSGWNITAVGGIYRAIGNILTFQANGGSWGPVNNLFLANKSDNSGVLISSVKLTQPLTMNNGDAINMRMSLSLQDFPS